MSGSPVAAAASASLSSIPAAVITPPVTMATAYMSPPMKLSVFLLSNFSAITDRARHF